MKIAVASNNNVNVSGHLGRCKGFMIYEVNDNEVINSQYRENTFTNHGHEHHHQHERGHGHGDGHSRLVEGLKDCQFIIFSTGGWRVIDDLKSAGITPVLTDERIAEVAVKKFLDGELIEKENGECRHH